MGRHHFRDVEDQRDDDRQFQRGERLREQMLPGDTEPSDTDRTPPADELIKGQR